MQIFKPLGAMPALVLVILLALAAAPWFVGLFGIATLSDMFMVAIIAIALNLIAGYGGSPAFGNVVFFGIGAYATGIVQVKYGAPFGLGLLAAALASALVAAIFGPLLFRLRGHYFAIGTLGLNGAVWQLMNNLPLSGGGKGLSLPLAPGTPHAVATFFYETFLATLVLSLLTAFVVARGRLGYAALAIRSGEGIAESLGIDAMRTRITLWTISAALTGLAGATYAYSLTYIEPSDVFNLGLSVKAFVVMLLGGTGTLLGPLVAAIFVEGAVALTQHFWLNYDVGVLGVIIIAVVLFLPNGVAGALAKRRERAAAGARG